MYVNDLSPARCLTIVMIDRFRSLEIMLMRAG